MNPILLYPQNVTLPEAFRKTAEKQGIVEQRVSRKIWEAVDEMLYAEKLVELRKKAKVISNEELDATFDQLLGRNRK